jgi:2-C-methyl-D-erythritol 2,4-cyclodiphosphate synthase
MHLPRVGTGYDVHPLVEGRPLIIGGVTIPYEKGLDGHSDADVLIHAICDALLGAAGLGDIGKHFPETEASYRNADSRTFLKDVREKLYKKGYDVHNIDATVIAQAPRLASYMSTMQTNIAQDLGLKLTQVNVKATTTEHLGFEGRGEGIAAQAAVLIYPLRPSSF